MNIKIKILAVIFIAAGLYWLIHRDDRSNPPPQIPAPSNIVVTKPTVYFSPESVTKIIWTNEDKTLTLTKSGDQWRSSSPLPLDPWQISRRLNIISKFVPEKTSTITMAPGKIIIPLATKTIEGRYDADAFVWSSGDLEGQGISFAQHPEIGEIFKEGLFGFRHHEVEICHPDKVTGLSITGAWSLTKRNAENKTRKGQDSGGPAWVTTLGENTEPARNSAVRDFVKNICKVAVENFKPEGFDKKNARAFLNLVDSGAKIEIKKAGNVYHFRDLNFTSPRLTELSSISWDDIKDPSSEEGRAALDNGKSTQERVKAIRKIKEAGSAEGIPALKALVFENTEIDVYRYEAVDALAAIGTRESFALIAKRLSEVGRSGFQLRLARALAAAMGRPFLSDEKTPETERQQEVRELLAAYNKNPI